MNSLVLVQFYAKKELTWADLESQKQLIWAKSVGLGVWIDIG